MKSLARSLAGSLVAAVLVTAPVCAAAAEAVPALAIVPCPKCPIKPGILQVITKAYAESADYEGYVVDWRKSVTLTIVEFNERDENGRSLLGPLAGRDYIKGVVQVEGQEITVEDSAFSSFSDITTVAEFVGIKAQKKVAEALKPR